MRSLLKLEGDISADEVIYIQKLLNSRSDLFSIECQNPVKTADSFETPEFLSTAAAIAAVLSFLKELWKYRKKTDSKERKTKLEKKFEEFEVIGFEVTSIDSEERHVKIILEDIPEKKIIEFSSLKKSIVSIKKYKKRSNLS